MEVGVYEAKTHFAKLIERVQKGERITITNMVSRWQNSNPWRIPAWKNIRAVESLLAVGESMRSRGVRLTRQEIVAAKNEGRR